MKIKKTWVPIVASLVLIVGFLALPVSAQVGPVQGADVSATVPEGPILDAPSLVQLWNELLEVVGLASGSQGPTDPPAPKTHGPFSSDELTTQDAPIDNQGDVRGTITPNG